MKKIDFPLTAEKVTSQCSQDFTDIFSKILIKSFMEKDNIILENLIIKLNYQKIF